MKNYIYLACLLFTFACRNQVDIPTNTPIENQNNVWSFDLPEWVKNANIYEVNLRQHTQEGTFSAFTQDIPRLKNMGVDILWLMPIFPISDTKKKGKLGSYYAVSNFRSVNPEFGTMADFKNLLSTAQESGMKVILDWVPNHTGWDHVWISEHPDYYTQDSVGNIIDPINYETGESWGWTDVADLNYDNEAMREEMLQDISFWVTEIGVDGFRMDVAHGVPIDFWESCAKRMKAHSEELFLLAEAQIAEQLQKEYFHMAYAWDFHHLLNEVAQEEKDAEVIYGWLENEQPKYEEGVLMHFTSNHDENSWAGTVFERMGEAHLAMAVITYTFDGMPLVYSGMEEPMRKRLAFFQRDPIEFNQYAYQLFYTTLNELKHRNQALWNGDYGGPVKRLGDNPKVLAFSREKNSDKVVVMVNLTGQEQEVTVDQSLEGMTEVFSNKKGGTWTSSKIKLSPHSYLVFSNN